MQRFMSDQKEILFIKQGGFSNTNQNVYKQLLKHFPDCHIKVTDIYDDILSPNNPCLIFNCIRLYGLAVLINKAELYRKIFNTPYAFNRVRERYLQTIGSRNYAFTFSTMSLFDFSIQGINHFIYTDHTHLSNLHNPAFNPSNLASEKWIQKEKTIYKNAAIVFTMSNNITRSLLEEYELDAAQVECAFCGTNTTVNAEFSFTEERYARKEILFVGIDWQRKGGPTLLKAFEIVRKAFPDAKLTIVGCDPKVNQPGCKVVGKVSLNEVGHYYRGASVFCLPTTSEPLGIVFLEAMAYSLPVVATNIEAIPEFIHEGKNGYLVEPGDYKALASAIIELVRSPARCRDFGSYGHELYSKRYTWNGVGDRMFSSIHQCLDRTKPVFSEH